MSKKNVFLILLRFIFIKFSKNNLIKSSKLIGAYWYDDLKNKVNGQFDVVILDDTCYIFYGVKFIDKKVDETILNEEIEQLSKLNISYYKLGFIFKNCSTLNKEMYNLFSLDDLYNIKIKVA